MRTLLIKKYTKNKNKRKKIKESQLVFAQWERGKGASDNDVCLLLVNCGLHTEYLNMEKCPFTY